MAAEKGNQYALGNRGGRPPLYDNKEELFEKCNSYFDWIINNEEKPTITGLAIYLGFCSRSTIYEYEKKKEFSYIIKRAMLLIENEYEKALRNDRTATGSIFVLKNMDWSDKQEIDHSGSIGNFDLSKYTKEEKAVLLKIARENEPE